MIKCHQGSVNKDLTPTCEDLKGRAVVGVGFIALQCRKSIRTENKSQGLEECIYVYQWRIGDKIHISEQIRNTT